MARMIPGGFAAMGSLPAVQRMRQQALSRLGIPEAAFMYMDYPATFDATDAQAALAGSGITCPPLHEYAWKVWDYWERHLDPQLPTPANVRRVVGGRVVVITGASSGIGRAVCKHLAVSGATIIGVARRVEQLEEMRAEVASAGGKAYVYPTDLSDHDACTHLIERVIARPRPRRRAHQQRRTVDPPLRPRLARSFPRLRANDEAELLRRDRAHHGGDHGNA